MEVMTDIFLWGGGSKVTAGGDCSHEIKRLAPWKKTMTNLDGIVRSRDIILLQRSVQSKL